ncbi:MAG: HAD-IIB family hydrolase [Fuerstiella sp.]
MTTKLVIFSDLDGCLLNKSDYDWSAAKPVLQELRRLNIPVVMNSSKTPAEMGELAREFQLDGLPFISENGGVIEWNDLTDEGQGSRQILGASRDQILQLLQQLKAKYQFQSFFDLGVDGVMRATDLSRDKATLACDRQSTEPLLWEDSDVALGEFKTIVEAAGLTFTRGGRFWHVTGQNSKGAAMQKVAQRFAKEYGTTLVTAGIGDSPIDQSMLDVADYAIGIPATGSLNVQIDETRGIAATHEGSTGWAEAVTELLKRCEINREG